MGRPFTLLDGLDEPTQARLYEAVVSERREKFIEIYRRFGLEQRGIKEDSFAKWARKERRDHRSKQVAASLPSLPAPSGAFGRNHALFTLERTSEAIHALMDAGDFKTAAVLASLQRAQMDYLRLNLEEAAEQRAKEKFDLEMTALRAKQDEALGQVKTTAQLTPEQVAEIRAKVLGL